VGEDDGLKIPPDADADTDADADADGDADADTDADADADPVAGELPEVPDKAGVAYGIHYLSSDLSWVKTTDDDFEDGTLDMDFSGHDITVDPVNDLIAVASDEGREVVIFSVDRPGAGSVSAPTQIATVGTEDPAYIVRMDPYHDRLYVLTADGSAGSTTPMHVYDSSDPSDPQYLTSFAVPLTASLDLDPVRQLLFATDMGSSDNLLRMYDVAGDELVELDGSPIDLTADYPQENSWGFSAHYLTVDPWNARVFAGRVQGTLSELIAYSYDPVVPGAGTAYRDLADMDLVGMLADGIDVDVYYEDRVSLLSAFQAMPDPLTGDVYMSGDAWNGSASTQVFVAYDPDLMLWDRCDSDTATDNLCYWQGTSSGSASGYRTGEGISCYDWTHGQAMGLSIEFGGEYTSNFVRFEADGGELTQVHAPSTAPVSGSYAIGLACH
jgi:hypothetical protein